MAQLLVKSINGENPQRYVTGDIVVVVDDNHKWGREESLDQWVAEARDPAKWPGHFTIVRVPGDPVPNYMQYLAAGAQARRLYTLDLTQFPVAGPGTSSTVTTSPAAASAAITQKIGVTPAIVAPPIAQPVI